MFLLTQAASKTAKNLSMSPGQKLGIVWEMALTSAAAGRPIATTAVAAATANSAVVAPGHAPAASATTVLMASRCSCDSDIIKLENFPESRSPL